MGGLYTSVDKFISHPDWGLPEAGTRPYQSLSCLPQSGQEDVVNQWMTFPAPLKGLASSE